MSNLTITKLSAAFPSVSDFNYGSLAPSFNGPMSTIVIGGVSYETPFNYGAENSFSTADPLQTLSSNGLTSYDVLTVTFPANQCPIQDNASNQPPFRLADFQGTLINGSPCYIGAASFASNTVVTLTPLVINEWQDTMGITSGFGNDIFTHWFCKATPYGTQYVIQDNSNAPIFLNMGSFTWIYSPSGIIIASNVSTSNSFQDVIVSPIPADQGPIFGNTGGSIDVASGAITTGQSDDFTTQLIIFSDNKNGFTLQTGEQNYYDISSGFIRSGGDISTLGIPSGDYIYAATFDGNFYYIGVIDPNNLKSTIMKSEGPVIGGFTPVPLVSDDPDLAFIVSGDYFPQAMWAESGILYAAFMKTSDNTITGIKLSSSKELKAANYSSNLLPSLPGGCIPLCEY